MTFMSSLADNPGGSIYGQPGSSGDGTGEALDLVNRLKDREMRDFKDKANFMSDLSLKQQKMRDFAANNPDNAGTGPSGLAANLPGALTQRQVPGQPNTVLGHDPESLTGYQKADLGIRQQGANLASQRLAQQGKLGQEAIDVRSAQVKLNQQKSDQINAQKTADMERKVNESAERIRVAEERVKQAGTNAAALLKAHKEMADAVEERHKLELAQKQHQFDISSAQHEESIKALQKRLDQSGSSSTTTEINPEGTKKTVTTQRGTPGETITVTGRDGKKYQIPKDKEEEWNQNHRPEEDQDEE